MDTIVTLPDGSVINLGKSILGQKKSERVSAGQSSKQQETDAASVISVLQRTHHAGVTPPRGATETTEKGNEPSQKKERAGRRSNLGGKALRKHDIGLVEEDDEEAPKYRRRDRTVEGGEGYSRMERKFVESDEGISANGDGGDATAAEYAPSAPAPPCGDCKVEFDHLEKQYEGAQNLNVRVKDEMRAVREENRRVKEENGGMKEEIAKYKSKMRDVLYLEGKLQEKEEGLMSLTATVLAYADLDDEEIAERESEIAAFAKLLKEAKDAMAEWAGWTGTTT